MKVQAKRGHLVLALTRKEVYELRELLEPERREKEASPVTWLTRSKVRHKLFLELCGAVDGVLDTKWHDPDAPNGEDRWCHSSDDDEKRLSELYKAAYREGKQVGLNSSRILR